MIPLAGSPRWGTRSCGRGSRRAEFPEYVVAATVANAQVLIGVGIVLSGGPHSPTIAILLLPSSRCRRGTQQRGVDGRRWWSR